MKLRKLLIGSTAALFAGGVAQTAQAADPAGLVVTSMANYVEQCNSGKGFAKGDWCLTFTGKVEWGVTFGNTLDYGDDPWDADVDNQTWELSAGSISWSGFSAPTSSVLLTVSRPTDAGTLTLRLPIYGSTSGTPDLTIGNWRFNSNGVRYQNSFGAAQLTLTLQNPGTLGWNDPRGSTNDDDWNGPWPDFQAEVGFDAGFADLDFGFNVGQRTNDMDGFEFVTFGGYAQAEIGVGDLGTLTLRGDFDRVNAQGDGDGMPVSAYGFRADFDADIGDRLTLNTAFGWSRNYGYYGFKYDEHELGTYLFAEVGVTVDVSDALALAMTAGFTRGPDAPEDRVLDLQAKLTFTPSSASPLYVGVEVNHERQLGVMNDLQATNVKLTVGATF